MNTIIKEFKKLISNNMTPVHNNKRSGDFITHQELSLVYSDIKNDIQEIDRKFSIKFAEADIKFANIRKDIILLDDKLTIEIGNARDAAHRDLMEVKNEIIARMCVSEGNIVSLQDSVATLQGDVATLQVNVATLQGDVEILKSDVSQLKTDVSELKSDVSQLKTDVSELKSDVSELKSDVHMIKDYLFTKLTSDIKAVVKECLAEQLTVS